MQIITALLFNDFETLDLFGPVEVLGRLPEKFHIQYASLHGGVISNQHGVRLETLSLLDMKQSSDVVLIIGGQGTRRLVSDPYFLQHLKYQVNPARWVLSVCTGSALLAKAGFLNGVRATSNKRAWSWVIAQSDKVDWVMKARWVVDGKFYTSSGVSAGIDMSLAFIAERYGIAQANAIADQIEYRWDKCAEHDEFSDRWL